MATLKDQIAIERIDTDCYQPIVPLVRMGALSNWAYGGNILAIAVNAAYATIEKGQHLYSISGYFLRPASPSHKLICHVDRIRNTRNFRTRHLRVVQSDGKSEKPCLIATADFHMDEPADMLNYCGRPKLPIPPTPAEETATERTREPGLYWILDTMMVVHPHSSGWDGEDVSNIISAERFRLHRALQSEADQIAALAFYMDRGLAYIPAIIPDNLSQASACATLDFALRILTHGIDLRNWHISERQTFGARNARALSEGRVFNGSGQLLASMTQKSIQRPKEGLSRM